jgi:hypothetical protein
MATNVYSAQIGLVTSDGDVNIIYPRTLATNVSYTNADMTGVTTVGGALDWLNSNSLSSKDGANIKANTGLVDSNTTFNSDGSITQTFDDSVKNTTFNSDGSITETVRNSTTSGIIYTKTTIFNNDGSISETILEGGNS